MEITASFVSRINKIKRIPYGGYRLRMWGLMFLADVTGRILATALGHLVYGEWFNFQFFTPGEAEHTLSLMLCIFLFVNSRLYPGIGINPAEEIKLVVRYCVISFMAAMIMIYVWRPAWEDISPVPVFILVFSIVIMLLLRWSVRILATQAGMWGEPVVVLARGSQIDHLTNYFLTRGRLGFVPILATTDTAGKKAISSPVPVIDLRQLLSQLPLKDVDTILIDASFFGRNLGKNSYNKLTGIFKHVIFVSDMGWLEGASLAIRDFEGLTGIEARKDHLSSTNSLIKRGMDILGSLLGLLLFSPFLLTVMVLIKLDSPGPVFYAQERISLDRRKKKREGESTRRIFIYKFRSMQMDAEKKLAEYLAANPQALVEWKQTQKLRDDPRITRVGKWLRMFSIDEIPQLINVLRGEMSLVGPRPIVESETPHYGEKMEVYRSLRSGLTGLWQVSGRNHLSYKERVRLDIYYAHNWSIWLDLYILARTVWVVLSRHGAC